jgi:hypothetical protein
LDLIAFCRSMRAADAVETLRSNQWRAAQFLFLRVRGRE